MGGRVGAGEAFLTGLLAGLFLCDAGVYGATDALSGRGSVSIEAYKRSEQELGDGMLVT